MYLNIFTNIQQHKTIENCFVLQLFKLLKSKTRSFSHRRRQYKHIKLVWQDKFCNTASIPLPGLRRLCSQAMSICYSDWFRFTNIYVFSKQSQPPGHCNPVLLRSRGLHILGAHLLPKLRCYFAEFLHPSSLKRLGILSLPTCVGLGYGLL